MTQKSVRRIDGRDAGKDSRLYEKAWDNAREEISESIKRQYDTVRIGLTFLTSLSALSGFFYKAHPLFPTLVFLCVGFIACGFMYLMLTGEIRIMRAGSFCRIIEKHLRRFGDTPESGRKKKTTDEDRKQLSRDIPPFWEAYVDIWNEKNFGREGHYERKTQYAPFRVIITLSDFMALISLILFSSKFIDSDQTGSLERLCLFYGCWVLWAAAVVYQMLIVNSLINKVGAKLEETYSACSDEARFGSARSRLINWYPWTWGNFIVILLLLDIIFPEELKTDNRSLKGVRINNDDIRQLVRIRYNMKDMDRLQRFFDRHDTLNIPPKPNGLYAAVADSGKASVSGYSNTWIRDTVLITNYQREIGCYHAVSKTLSTLGDYFFMHQERFRNIITGKTDKDIPMMRPHIRFDGDTLQENDQEWPHAQNDALGYALWIVFKMANDNRYSLTALDHVVYSLFPPYFDAIEYWTDLDSGHWEEDRKLNASSIGVVVAALEQMKQYLEQHPSASFMFDQRKIDTGCLQRLILKGRSQLNKLLPNESPFCRTADAALLFLIYPLEVVSERQTREILKNVLTRLKGRYGIKRYNGDSYWCANYKKLLKEADRSANFSENLDLRNRMLIPGTEAQWCIFDPVVSVIYGRKYIRSGEKKYLRLQTHYFNRAMGQITSEKTVPGGGKCAEAYYVADSSKGRHQYIPNDQVPLAWTQANLGIAVEYMRTSIQRQT